MSTEHNEQPTELTYPTNDEQPTELTTIRLVLASDDSDKENHIPNIRRDEIAVKLEQPTTESLGGNSTEGTGGSTAIDRSDPLRQDLPRSVTPDTGTNGAETTRTMASIPDVLRDEIDRQPLRPIPLRQTQTRNQSFSNLRSGQEIHDRINYIAAFAGLTIAHDDQHRLARLWSLLKDDRFAVAVTQRARGLFNWQCADLIEIFINIAKLEWNEPLCPGTSIEQFGLDLLRRILAADVKRLYDAAIDDVRANQYGVIPKNENPMDLIYMKYTHPLTIIAPDRSHTIELINNVQDKTNDLAYYINKLSDLAETIQRNTKWTKKVYLGGAKPQTLTGEVIFNIEHFIADVENDYHGDCMTPPIPTAVFTVKEHTLLRIIIYLFQFLLCLIQVTLTYRCLRNRLRQTRTITHLTSIRIRDSHYRLSNLLSPPHSNNESHGLFLPDQPRLLRPVV
jgi:hypothetical protein